MTARFIRVLLGADGLRQYGDLYLGGIGSTFCWYVDRGNALTIAAIERAAKRRHRGIENGLDPDVEPGDRPRLYRMRRIGEMLQVQYAEVGSPRQIIDDSWHSTTFSPVRFLTMVLRPNPFTIELRGSMSEKSRAELLELIDADFNLRLSESTVKCDLSVERKRRALASSLHAVAYGERQLGRGTGLGYAEIYTNRNVPLEELPDYTEQQSHASERETFLLAWLFYTDHVDGFQEQAYYIVKVITGN